MDITSLHKAYASGRLTPEAVIEETYARIDAEGLHPVWITLVPREQAIRRAREMQSSDRAKLPLYGVPFAVKDNIDVAGVPTTAACPDYAYTPQQSATVVARLEAAGAILVGKTNMDQFATGLVGTRTPYGICSSVFDKRYISGGSSSGSAVAVANGLVSFSLGTDTAGSGRVPAMFNSLIGLKPTRGILSTHGVVPACRTLDCVLGLRRDCARCLPRPEAPPAVWTNMILTPALRRPAMEQHHGVPRPVFALVSPAPARWSSTAIPTIPLSISRQQQS